MSILLAPVLVCVLAALPPLLLPDRARAVSKAIAAAAAAANLVLAVLLFPRDLAMSLPWIGPGLEFTLRLDRFAAFVLLAAAGFGTLVTLYSLVFLRGRSGSGRFFGLILLTVGFTEGALLADSLLVLLTFWEGLLLALYGMIAAGGKGAFRTAVKAFLIVGATDLCLTLGIAFVGRLAGTLSMSAVHLEGRGLAGLAFVLLLVGAAGKAGAMPFHSWIPDAAGQASLPFMALVPAALEKLLGIYFLARLSLEMFALQPGSWLSTLLMVLGAATILLAVLMALVQKEYKRLLSYHAISQVGYMILGIGTAVPAGIVGGLFHMINNAVYKSCLFLTGGAVERQAGTTELKDLGGLAARMPVTFACFTVAAAAISGVPPFNGFFSKELVYDGALQRGWIFYAAALLGSFLTAASFLKLGHAAYLGRRRAAAEGAGGRVREMAWPALVPMVVLAGLCLLFGVWNPLPLNRLILPALRAAGGGGAFSATGYAGWPHSLPLVLATAAVLVLALLNHLYGARRSGSGAGAADHILHAPGLAPAYSLALSGALDPYGLARTVVRVLARLLWLADRAVDRLYETVMAGAGTGLAHAVRRAHGGNVSVYLLWALAGAVLLLLWVLR